MSSFDTTTFLQDPPSPLTEAEHRELRVMIVRTTILNAKPDGHQSTMAQHLPLSNEISAQRILSEVSKSRWHSSSPVALMIHPNSLDLPSLLWDGATSRYAGMLQSSCCMIDTTDASLQLGYVHRRGNRLFNYWERLDFRKRFLLFCPIQEASSTSTTVFWY